MLAQLAACSTSPNTPAPVRSLSNSFHDYPKGRYQGDSYRVKKGQTLYAIAWHTGMDFNAIATINRIPPPYTIQPGQLLSLKAKKSAPEFARKSPPQKKVSTVNKSKEEVKKTVDQKPRQDYRRSTVGQTVTSAKANLKVAFNPSSSWVWPASGQHKRVLSSTEGGVKGLDIPGKFGQPVVASAGGKVVYAGDGLRGYGRLVIIKHSQDYLSAYAHNSKIRVKEGQWIKPGQRIADMGSTGTDTVKLHFEIRFRGKPVNPIKYLSK